MLCLSLPPVLFRGGSSSRITPGLLGVLFRLILGQSLYPRALFVKGVPGSALSKGAGVQCAAAAIGRRLERLRWRESRGYPQALKFEG